MAHSPPHVPRERLLAVAMSDDLLLTPEEFAHLNECKESFELDETGRSTFRDPIFRKTEICLHCVLPVLTERQGSGDASADRTKVND